MLYTLAQPEPSTKPPCTSTTFLTASGVLGGVAFELEARAMAVAAARPRVLMFTGVFSERLGGEARTGHASVGGERSSRSPSRRRLRSAPCAYHRLNDRGRCGEGGTRLSGPSTGS